jgi:hypothetical protein
MPNGTKRDYYTKGYVASHSSDTLVVHICMNRTVSVRINNLITLRRITAGILTEILRKSVITMSIKRITTFTWKPKHNLFSQHASCCVSQTNNKVRFPSTQQYDYIISIQIEIFMIATCCGLQATIFRQYGSILESLNNCNSFVHNYSLMMVACRPKRVAIITISIWILIDCIIILCWWKPHLIIYC